MINYEAFLKISYGLYIVSSGDKNKGNGFISNSVFQVTAVPPQFAVCCNKGNFTSDIIKQSKAFSISVLHQGTNAQLIGKFGYKSGRDINKLEGSNFIEGIDGIPVVLDGTTATMECKLVYTFDVGTHFLFIGEVIKSDLTKDLEPLTYAHYRKVMKGIAPKNAPTFLDKSKFTALETPASPRYKCPACGYIYTEKNGDPEHDINPGTKFKDIPDEWTCPICGTEKEDFYKI